nr:hypothetical protein [uncultured Methanoregula sp.]
MFAGEELVSKVEWSVVQAVQYQHRDETSDRVRIVKMDGYSLVGIPVHDARKEIWIMLNTRNSPYYKQLPKGNYTLSANDLKTILASGVVVSTVANCLESHVNDLNQADARSR